MKIFTRKMHLKIKPYVDTQDIVVIHGARQTGKTVLLNSIYEINTILPWAIRDLI